VRCVHALIDMSLDLAPFFKSTIRCIVHGLAMRNHACREDVQSFLLQVAEQHRLKKNRKASAALAAAWGGCMRASRVSETTRHAFQKLPFICQPVCMTQNSIPWLRPDVCELLAFLKDASVDLRDSNGVAAGDTEHVCSLGLTSTCRGDVLRGAEDTRPPTGCTCTCSMSLLSRLSCLQ